MGPFGVCMVFHKCACIALYIDATSRVESSLVPILFRHQETATRSKARNDSRSSTMNTYMLSQCNVYNGIILHIQYVVMLDIMLSNYT